MAEVKYLEAHGQQILLMDFAYLEDAKVLARPTGDAIAMVRSASAPHSVLALLDLTGTPLNRALFELVEKAFAKQWPVHRSHGIHRTGRGLRERAQGAASCHESESITGGWYEA